MTARAITSQELSYMLREHHEWLRSGSHYGSRADFTASDLRRHSFWRANLRNAVLDRCILRGVNFDHADLTAASLRGADLEQASLRQAHLSGADLSGASLRRARLDQADLLGAKLEGVDWQGASLHEVERD